MGGAGPGAGSAGSAGSAGGAGGAAAPQTLVKIKVWFGPDNCVVIRMPPDFSFVDLGKKLLERRKLEPGFADDASGIDVFYRDDADGKLYPMRGDEDLRVAMERNAKLTLDVHSVG
jgi:bud emergence protein 1